MGRRRILEAGEKVACGFVLSILAYGHELTVRNAIVVCFWSG